MIDWTLFYQPKRSTGYIRVNGLGQLVIQSPFSDVACVQTLEQLFTDWYIKRY